MGQQQDSIKIISQKLIGYSVSKAGFHDVAGLPRYEVKASINGAPVKLFIVTFQPHHISDGAKVESSNVKNLYQAISFDWKAFTQNGVALPSFGPSTSLTEQRLLSSQLGASHVGGHNSDVVEAIGKLADRHDNLRMLLKKSTPEELPYYSRLYNDFIDNAKATVNGITTKVRADLQKPGNGITLVRTDPDNPRNTGSDAPERPYKLLGEHIDEVTGTFVEGSKFAEDPLVKLGAEHGSGAAQFQLTPWQDDPAIDIKTANFIGEPRDAKLLLGDAYAERVQAIVNVSADPNISKADISTLGSTPDGGFSLAKLSVAALAIESLKKLGVVGDLVDIAGTIAEAHRLVAAGQIEQAEQELGSYLAETAGGAIWSATAGFVIAGTIAAFFPATAPLSATIVVLYGAFAAGFYGGQSAEGIAQKLVAKLQKSLEGGGSIVLDDIIKIYNELAIAETGTPAFRQIMGEGGVKGYVIPETAAKDLEALPGTSENSIFDLGDGNYFLVHEGLKPGQSIVLQDPGAIGSAPIHNPDQVYQIGVSDGGRAFSITGEQLHVANILENLLGDGGRFGLNLTGSEKLRAVLDLVAKIKLVDDFRPASLEKILKELGSIENADLSSGGILVSETLAKITQLDGNGHQVFALSDGNYVLVPDGLTTGQHVSFVEDRSLFIAGNPNYDPVIGAGYDYAGAYFETKASDIQWYLDASAAIDQNVGIKAVVEGVNNQQVSFAQEVIISLRAELEDGDEDDGDTVSGGEGDDLLIGDPGEDNLVYGLRAPAPHVVHRQAVFSDADGDGVLDSVTRVTSFSNNTQVRKTFTLDSNGVPITEGRVALYRFDQAVDGAAIGSIFGSQLGNALVGDNLFAQIGAGSVLSAVLGSFGDAIDLYFTDNAIDSIFEPNQQIGSGPGFSFGESLDSAFEDFGANVLDNIKSAGVGALSGFLAGELGEAIGLDGGFEGQLFQAVTSRTIGTVANTVIDNAVKISNGSNIDLFHNLDPSTLLEAGAGAVSTFIGGYLAREIVSAESQAGAIGGSIGGAIGSAIGFGLAGVGFLSGLSGSAIGSLVGGTLGSTVFGISLGAIILPGVGAFLGTILGTVLGDFFNDLFGGGGHPKGTANISLDFESGLYYESGTNAANGGGAQLAMVTSLAERSESIINSYIEMLGGENANSHSPSIRYYQVANSSSVAGLHISVEGPGGASVDRLHEVWLRPHEVTGAGVDQAVEDAVLAAVKAIQTKGGDIYLKRAVLNSKAEDLRAFAGDLKIAEDYKAYLKDKAVINALIAEEPSSAFAAGWLITLLRAEELGLTSWQESDFYGGLEGLLQSLEVEAKFGIAIDAVDISVVVETLDDGSTRKDLVLKAGSAEDAEIIARINGFEAAAGFTIVEGANATGTAGKDLWFAGDGGGTFTDQAVWSDQHSHDVLIGGAGNDTINGGLGWDFILGGAGDDTLRGGAHEDTIFGQAGNDTLIGDDSSYSGGSGLESGTDADSSVGADANDGSTREWFGFKPGERGPIGSYNNVPERTPFGADRLDGGEGSDTIIGVGGSDHIFGGAGDDWLYGGEDGSLVDINEALYDGDDLIEGGEGADHIDGGQGFDTASYAGSALGVTVSLQQAGPQVSLGDASGDLLISIEDLIGSAFDDHLTGDAGANVIDGGAGDDHIDGAGGDDTVSYFSFGQGVTVALASDPGQPGKGIAQVLGEDADGNPVVVEEDALWSIENVIGSGHDDVIGGSDLAAGTLSGREGNDLFEIAFDDVAVAAGSFATTVLGGAGFDTLSFANLTPAGTTGAAADLTDTNSGNVFSSIEYVIGSDGDDTFTTGYFSDYLEGGLGNDLLSGGGGKDKYIFNFGDGEDTVTDTSGDAQSLLSGGDDDTVSFGAGIAFRHITGELSAGSAPGFLSSPPAGHFDTADLTLGIRDITSTAQDYETSLSALSDTVTVKYGGAYDALTVGAQEVEAGAGVVERLQFADSGHIDMAGVHTFTTGSLNADTTAASSATGGTWMFTGAGDDVLSGGAQGDVLIGGEGLDLASGGDGDDQYAYWLGDGHDILDDTGGLDTLVFGGGIRIDDLNFRKGALSDAADPSSFVEAASGENGVDLRVEIIDPADGTTVLGSVTIRNYRDKDQMIERIRASALDKAIEALKELDPVQFAEIDTAVQLQYSSSIDVPLSQLLGEAITSENADHVTAAEGQTVLSGYGGDDTLRAGETDDVLDGGAGADELHGGLGIDFASYENAAAGVVVDLSLDRQAQRDGGDFEEEGDRLRDIEGVIGSSHADMIKGNVHENILIGGGGDDHLTGDADPSGQASGTAGDTFVFDGAHGNDIVYDFEVGRDTLEFLNVDRSTIALSINGANTTLTHSQGSVQINGVQWSTLPQDRSIIQNGTALSSYGNIIMQQSDGAAVHQLDALSGAVYQTYTFALEDNAQYGTVTVADDGDGTFSYSYQTTSDSFSGQDSFSVKITGADGAEQIALVDVEVQPSSQVSSAKTLYGSLGHDDLTSGLGNDTVYGDVTNTSAVYDLQGGNDTIDGSNGTNRLYGDGYNLRGASSGGSDTLIGGTGVDTLFGDTYYLFDTSTGGDDTFTGGGGNDNVFGDSYYLQHNSAGGDDILNGDDGNDYLYGDGAALSHDARGGNDVLLGGAGADYLYGDGVNLEHTSVGGDDRLDGGVGNDQLYGDASSIASGATRGSDTFVFDGTHGADIVHDFEVSRDALEFQNIDASTFSLSVSGSNTILTHSQGSVQLNGVKWVSLPANGAVSINGSVLSGYGNIIMQQGAGAVAHVLDTLPGSAAQAYTFALEDSAQNGLVTVTDNGDGTFSYSYEPTSSTFSGSDTFSVKIIGADGSEQIGLVAVEVQPSSQASSAKTLYGSLGHDQLTSGLGNDTVYGDVTTTSAVFDLQGGNDRIDGSSGTNRLYGDGYNLRGASAGGDDTLTGGAGVDTLYGDGNYLYDNASGGDDVVSSGAGNDKLYGDGYYIYHNTTGGDDTLSGGDGNDYLYGDARNLSSDARGGDDALFGGAGADYLYGDAQTLDHSAVAGDDRLDGGAGNDQLYGDAPTISARATRGSDTFVFDGTHGADIVHDFEVSRDALEFQNIDASTLSVSVSGSNTILTHSQGSVQLNGVQWVSLPANGAVSVNGSVLAGYGNIIMQQGAGVVAHVLDVLPGSVAQAYTFALEDSAQNGLVTVTDNGDGTFSYSYETTSDSFSGQDSFSVKITGADGAEQIALVGVEVQPSSQVSSAKTLYGSLGHDDLTSGLGNDTVYGDVTNTSAVYDLQGGNDTIDGSNGTNRLYGDGYNLRGASSGGSDTLIGGTGVDTLYGDTYYLFDTSIGGDDTLTGGGGNDNVYGDSYYLQHNSAGGDDILNGGANKDRLFGEAYRMYHNTKGGDDVLEGGDGADILYGDADYIHHNAVAGDDILRGGDGNDSLFGDGYYMDGGTVAGDDVLDGGSGNDSLWGDAWVLRPGVTRGSDRFLFDGAHGSDIVHDFEPSRDVLEFHNIDASTLILSISGVNSVLTHSQGSVQINGVQWDSIHDVPISVGGVTDSNNAPTAIILSNNEVEENSFGAVIGDVSIADEDIDDTHNVAIEPIDASMFEIVSTPGAAFQLKLKDDVALDFEALPDGDAFVPITLIATDAAGNEISQTFSVSINDLAEPAPLTADYSSAENAITIDLGADTVIGGGGVYDDISQSANAIGTAYDDKIIGDHFDNMFTGRGGRDAFVLNENFGYDTITDFDIDLAKGDRILFDANTFASFAEISQAATQVGEDTVIMAPNGVGSLTLIELDKIHLQSEHFELL